MVKDPGEYDDTDAEDCDIIIPENQSGDYDDSDYEY